MRIKNVWYILLMIMMIPMVTACSSDKDDAPTLSKSELIGTWYTLEDDWVLEFKDAAVTQYEIWKSGDQYVLNTSYVLTYQYAISGSKITNDEGVSVTAIINGNTLKVSANGKTLTYTKFNGTVQQLMDYLNSK